jgi:MoaA/NifB/PqqE/SkfB family radical SAM enzyme
MKFEDKLYCSIAMGGWAEIGHTGEPESSPNVNGDVYPCCPGWLKDDTNPAGYDFGNLYTDKWEDIWNGKKAQEFRKSILDGTFKYCNENLCPHLQNVHSKPNVGSIEGAPAVRKMKDIELLYKERGEYHRNVIENQLIKLKLAPDVMKMDYDRSCNLSCPSCRIELITPRGKEFELIEKIQNSVIKVIQEGTRKLYITGTGDPFGSATLRKFLLNFKKKDFPSVKTIRLHTNGVKWTKEIWNKMSDLHGLVTDAEVSIDAATKNTYGKVRRGGDWDQLMENLKFIPKEVPWFGMSMVVQDTNYKEIPKLIKLRDKLVKESGNKSIYVYFSKITNWGTFTDKEYEKKAVWKESHSNYSDLVRILNENVKKSYWQDRFMGTNMTDLLKD